MSHHLLCDQLHGALLALLPNNQLVVNTMAYFWSLETFFICVPATIPWFVPLLIVPLSR